ncbi:MAG: NUDIX domain-containing protein [Clostridia bacterium]|nr:NUDIX domain-containing protein [Clostridia bacterium]
MAKEMIDELNNKGEKIGVVDKDIAHEKGLWHMSVHVWLVNDDNKILLQHRCAEKKLFPNTWDCSFAGHISAGETPIQAVLREGKEEIGIDVDLERLSLLFTNREMIKYKDINSNEFVYIFLLKQNFGLDEMKFQKEEVSGAKYVSINDFYDMIDRNELLPHKVEYSVLKKYLRK